MIINIVLIGAGVLIVGIVVVLVSPTRKCGRCKGLRVTRHRLTGKHITCPRCSGTGRHYRLGATAVHKFMWSLRDARHAEQQAENLTSRLTMPESPVDERTR